MYLKRPFLSTCFLALRGRKSGEGRAASSSDAQGAPKGSQVYADTLACRPTSLFCGELRSYPSIRRSTGARTCHVRRATLNFHSL